MRLREMSEIEDYLAEKRLLVDEALDRYLPPEETYPPLIHSAMRYTVLAPAKRLRAILVLASGEACGRTPGEVMPAACAVEMIHAYSLIHDDLPCMDDDDYRRGRLTSHKVYGEAVATLAGDALLTLGFETMARNAEFEAVGPLRTLRAIREIAVAVGTEGMIGGQVVDIQCEGREVDPELVRYIHSHKTGAFIRACARIGGILAGAGDEEIEILGEYGESIGLAFQVIDDILDVTGDETRLGKRVGRDREKAKVTYPLVFGLERSREFARELTRRAKDSLGPMRQRARVLEGLADWLLARQA